MGRFLWIYTWRDDMKRRQTTRRENGRDKKRKQTEDRRQEEEGLGWGAASRIGISMENHTKFQQFFFTHLIMVTLFVSSMIARCAHHFVTRHIQLILFWVFPRGCRWSFSWRRVPASLQYHLHASVIGASPFQSKFKLGLRVILLLGHGAAKGKGAAGAIGVLQRWLVQGRSSQNQLAILGVLWRQAIWVTALWILFSLMRVEIMSCFWRLATCMSCAPLMTVCKFGLNWDVDQFLVDSWCDEDRWSAQLYALWSTRTALDTGICNDRDWCGLCIGTLRGLCIATGQYSQCAWVQRFCTSAVSTTWKLMSRTENR